MTDLVASLQHKNMYELLKYAAQKYRDLPAITDCENLLSDHSYQELFEHVQQVASGLQVYRKTSFQHNSCSNDAQQGNEPCHYVLCAKNSYNWIVCFLANSIRCQYYQKRTC